jgi:hypothetical protein
MLNFRPRDGYAQENFPENGIGPHSCADFFADTDMGGTGQIEELGWQSGVWDRAFVFSAIAGSGADVR